MGMYCFYIFAQSDSNYMLILPFISNWMKPQNFLHILCKVWCRPNRLSKIGVKDSLSNSSAQVEEYALFCNPWAKNMPYKLAITRFDIALSSGTGSKQVLFCELCDNNADNPAPVVCT